MKYEIEYEYCHKCKRIHATFVRPRLNKNLVRLIRHINNPRPQTVDSEVAKEGIM